MTVLFSMPDIDVDTSLDSTGVEVLEGAGVDEDTIDMMLDDVPAMLVIVLAAIDDTVLLIELLDVVAVIPVVLDEATAIVPVMVEAINEIVLLLKSGAGVVVLVKLVVLDDANVAATVDDELFGDATAVILLLTDTLLLVAAGIGVEVLEGTGVEVLAIPAVLDDANPVVLSPAKLVCAAVLVMTAVGDEGAMALEATGAGVVVMLAAPVLLLQAASAGVDEMLEGRRMDVSVPTVPLDDVAAAVLEMTAVDDASVLLPGAFRAGVVVPVTLVVPAVLVPTIDNDDVLLLVEVLESTGVDVAATPVVLDDGANDDDATVVLVLLAIDDANMLLFEAAGIGVEILDCAGVEVLAIPAVLDVANPVVLFPAVLVCAAVLVMTAVGDEGVLALEEAGEGVAVMLAASVLLLEAARAGVKVLDGANVELLVISVLFVNGVVPKKTAVDDAYVLMSRAFGAGVVVFVAPTLLEEANTAVLIVTDVDDMLIVEVLEGSIEVVATVELLDDANVAVLIVEDDEALLLTPNGVGVEEVVGIGMDVVVPPEVLRDITFAMPELLDTPLQLLASGLAGKEDVPSGHARQFADPDVFLKLPTSHAVHRPPSTPVKPALHKQSLESALAEGEVELAGQSKQLPPSDVSL